MLGSAWLENTAPADVCDIEPGPEPLLARNGRSSLARSRSWLEIVARAWPGAAVGSKWPLEPGPEPQLAREMAARAWPSAAAGSKWTLERAPEPQNARQVPLESAPEPRNARLVPFEPPRKCRMLDGSRSSLLWRHSMLEKCRSRPLPRGAFVACVRNGRSKNAGTCSSIIGILFGSVPPCFVHVMHGFTLVCISEVGGCSTGNSFRFSRVCVRAVWLPSGIGSQKLWAGLFPFPFWTG